MSWRRALELDVDLVHPAGDAVRGPRALDERRVVLAHDHASRAPERLERDVLQRQPRLGRDDVTAGERREILEVRDPPVAETRRADRRRGVDYS